MQGVPNQLCTELIFWEHFQRPAFYGPCLGKLHQEEGSLESQVVLEQNNQSASN